MCESRPCVACRKDEHDPFREEAASDEREHPGRGAVEPLRVVDHAEQRLLLCRIGEEAENRKAHEEWARGLAGAAAKGNVERLALRVGEMSRELQERRTELLQRRIVELLSPSTPAVATTRKSSPALTAHSSSAVLPTPGSPYTTSTAP